EFADIHAGDKQYGGVPIATIAGAIDEGSGAELEALGRAEGFGDQPNPFDAQIVTEMKNTGTSATWQARFDAHLAGQAIAVPYPAVDVTDAAKRMAAARSYQDVVRGAAARGTLTDVRPVFSADATEKLGFVPAPGADGKTVLLEMCARCHDGRGNPGLAKNQFNVLTLDRLAQEPVHRPDARGAVARREGHGDRPHRRVHDDDAHAALARQHALPGRHRRRDRGAAEIGPSDADACGHRKARSRESLDPLLGRSPPSCGSDRPQ